MPYFTEQGSNKSPCYYQKKNSITGSCHPIPQITKRPIEKVTTRAQAQYQQKIKSMGTDSFLESDRNNNNKNTNTNNNASRFLSDKITPSNTTSSNVSPPTAAKRSQLPANDRRLFSGDSPLVNPKAIYTVPGVKPHLVLQNLPGVLSSHEKKEILNFSEVYFCGIVGIKKRTPRTATTITGSNGLTQKVYGFDDDKGSYMPIINDHIAYRYEVLRVIGKGTFGVVVQAFDHRTGSGVAVKIIRNQARFHTQAKEEIKILEKLLDSDKEDKFNVVHMLDNFMFRNHTCIIFELLSLNLFELSKKNTFLGFSITLIRSFAYAILKCLHVLSKFNIIHCDLKPENILLKQHDRTGIKVIDFGSSCFATKRIHNYIQSRYYRSPEVILGAEYGPPIDMWSFGCILAELYIGRPLLDGENEGDQFACMVELLDMPAQTFLSKCKVDKIAQFIDSSGNPSYCARYVGGKYKPESGRSPRGKYRGPPGSRKLFSNCNDEDFKDFVRQCLVWDPIDRMTPALALRHPWMTRRPPTEELL